MPTRVLTLAHPHIFPYLPLVNLIIHGLSFPCTNNSIIMASVMVQHSLFHGTSQSILPSVRGVGDSRDSSDKDFSSINLIYHCDSKVALFCNAKLLSIAVSSILIACAVLRMFFLKARPKLVHGLTLQISKLVGKSNLDARLSLIHIVLGSHRLFSGNTPGAANYVVYYIQHAIDRHPSCRHIFYCCSFPPSFIIL